MSNQEKRGKVWLAVAGLVKDQEGKWLVVKKKYGGLKGQWSLPAGFMEPGETADQAVIREVKEETGVECTVKGLIGLRTGVLKEEISDNLLVFELVPTGEGELKAEEHELYEAVFKAPEELLADKNSSLLLGFLIPQESTILPLMDGLNPGNQFGYTSYKLFF